MIRICAWCQQEVQRESQRQSSKIPAAPISHGICEDHPLGLRGTYPRSLPLQAVSASSYLIVQVLEQAEHSNEALVESH